MFAVAGRRWCNGAIRTNHTEIAELIMSKDDLSGLFAYGLDAL